MKALVPGENGDPHGEAPTVAWGHAGEASGLDRPSDYSTRLELAGSLAIVGFESVSEAGKETRLMAYDLDGCERWEIPLATEEGAYPFAHSYSPGLSIVIVGTDDSRLAGYRVGL